MSDIRAKKALGQNFLTDMNTVAMIIEAADIRPDDDVLEIGPGLGVLTHELAAKAGHVTAIELDERLFHKLNRELDYPNLDIILGDALKFPYEQLEEKVKVVANLPYYISTPLITRLLDARENIISMVLMLQKEVAERLTAPPGGKEYGYMTVMVRLYADAKMLFTVSKEAFDPVPKVDSAVIRIDVLDKPAAECRDYDLFEKVVSAAFSQRRKTLRNTLKGSGMFTPEGISTLENSGIDPGRRAETLSVAEFAQLTDFLAGFRS